MNELEGIKEIYWTSVSWQDIAHFVFKTFEELYFCFTTGAVNKLSAK